MNRTAMATLYNEFDAFAAEWMRELMKEGVIAEGEVDERSIEDVAPDDLVGYRRVHLFSGIAVWQYALQLAGFPADREVWTCSCPCQPFSTAGKGDGFADERHLWPAAFHLIAQRRPLLCFGEQVASDDGFAWLDLVQADLESLDYTVGALVAPAAGFGAPHGRHRIYWVARQVANGVGHRQGTPTRLREPTGGRATQPSLCGCARAVGQADSASAGREEDACRKQGNHQREGARGSLDGYGLLDGSCGHGIARGVEHAASAGRCGCAEEWRSEEPGRPGGAGELVNPIGGGVRGGGPGTLPEAPGASGSEVREQRVRTDARPAGGAADSAGVAQGDPCGEGHEGRDDGDVCGTRGRDEGRGVTRPSPVGGFWGNAVWLACTDGKYRAVEPMPFAVADGLARDLGLVRVAGEGEEEVGVYFPLVKGRKVSARLRGYGNAICLWQAVAFIRAYLEEEAEGGLT